MSGLHRNCHPDTIDIETDLALIAVVGRAMKSNRGTAGRIFSALAHAHVNVKMIDQGSSELNIIIGVNGEAVSTTKELNEKKNEHNAGDSITLTISRNGKDMEVKVTLQEITQGDTLFGDQEAVEN